jgi:hypothetical protein
MSDSRGFQGFILFIPTISVKYRVQFPGNPNELIEAMASIPQSVI